jgi:hypothetical protein
VQDLVPQSAKATSGNVLQLAAALCNEIEEISIDACMHAVTHPTSALSHLNMASAVAAIAVGEGPSAEVWGGMGHRTLRSGAVLAWPPR